MEGEPEQCAVLAGTDRRGSHSDHPLLAQTGAVKPRAASLFGALLVMGGVILNRFNVTWFVVSPVDGEVYVPHWMEVVILAGVVAGIVLVYSLIARYFPVYEETVRVKRPIGQARLRRRRLTRPRRARPATTADTQPMDGVCAVIVPES
ncbi:MAG: hypothetical protein IPM16_00890 [Chloroflexi bacterium]|nr:hypothetical protein [Chloroflexota bacterium]